ncbi:MAG: hypothetical protein ACE5K0_00410, partial [Candidatus Methanofastidiosia archaeon]
RKYQLLMCGIHELCPKAGVLVPSLSLRAYLLRSQKIFCEKFISSPHFVNARELINSIYIEFYFCKVKFF